MSARSTIVWSTPSTSFPTTRAYFSLKEGRCGGAQGERGLVFLDAGLELLDAACGAAGADYDHAGGQRVEGAGMAYLELADAQAPDKFAPEPVDSVEGSPLVGLVDAEYFAFYEIHGVGGGFLNYRQSLRKDRSSWPGRRRRLWRSRRRTR